MNTSGAGAVVKSRKRTLDEAGLPVMPAKRTRTELVVAETDKVGTIDPQTNARRTSNLMAPTVELTGHEGAVYTCRFSPDGKHFASAGHDKNVLLWHVYGECENHTVLQGHTGAVLQVQWGPMNDMLFSASADQTAAVWDVENGVRIKKVKDHTSFINSICPSRRGTQLFATGSDDGTAKIFDVRFRAPTRTFDSTYQVTAVCLSEDRSRLYTGGIDNSIKVWDVRYGQEPVGEYLQHRDTVTSLSLSKDGSYLVSNAMDNLLFAWDVRPYFQGPNRMIRHFVGAQHGTEKLLIKANWSVDGRQICCGSSDRFVYIFDFESSAMHYKLPGHKGSVNEVDLHPVEPIVLSCSSDKTLFLGELLSA